MGKSFRQKLESASTFFNIQSDVAQSIASELNATITPQEKRLIEKLPTDNLDAYEAYLKGLFYLNKVTPDALDSAMHYFELAKEIDPGYALAYTGICNVWLYRQQMGFIKPSEGNPKSMEAVMKAYSLDSNNAVVQYTLANKKTYGMFDWVGGESGYKKSISLNPNNAMTHTNYSNLLIILGRPEESLEQINIALKLDPMNPLIVSFYGLDLVLIRKYNEAIKVFQDALKIAPGYPLASGSLAWTYYFAGQLKEAYEQFKVAFSYDPELLKAIEQGYSEGGWKGMLISYNKVCEKRDNWSPSDIAGNYACMGFNDKAMYWFERAYVDRDPNLPYLLHPQLDALRSDPRFQDLCRRLKLPYRMNL
jgi:tetratricopeptide (TPR) repeat protein